MSHALTPAQAAAVDSLYSSDLNKARARYSRRSIRGLVDGFNNVEILGWEGRGRRVALKFRATRASADAIAREIPWGVKCVARGVYTVAHIDPLHRTRAELSDLFGFTGNGPRRSYVEMVALMG